MKGRKKLIDDLYAVAEDCHDFLIDRDEDSVSTLYRLDEEILDLEKRISSLKKARNVYARLVDLGLKDREAISNYIYEYGLYLSSQKNKEAITYLEQAADWGGEKAVIGYASSLIEGRDGVTSIVEGLDLLRQLAEKGSEEASYQIYSYYEKLPAYIEASEAKENYERLMAMGSKYAKKPLPKDFDLRPYTEKLKEAANQGDVSALYELSKRLGDVSPEEALDYLEKAVEKRYAPAEKTLASLYEEAGDKEKAKALYLQAAEDGEPHCYLDAAALLEEKPHFYEDGNEKAHQEERGLYEKAAACDVKEAVLAFGLYYRVRHQYQKANNQFKKGLSLGDNFHAPYYLGEAYRLGQGYKKDYGKAVSFYKKAAGAGNIAAMEALYNIYEKGGYGLKKDKAKASRYAFYAGYGRD